MPIFRRAASTSRNRFRRWNGPTFWRLSKPVMAWARAQRNSLRCPTAPSATIPKNTTHARRNRFAVARLFRGGGFRMRRQVVWDVQGPDFKVARGDETPASEETGYNKATRSKTDLVC